MRILLVNPPHTAIGSRVPDDHLPPLGLLNIAGGLIDSGHRVELLDADRTNMALAAIDREIAARAPHVLMIGHAGSTSAHPTALAIAKGAKARNPALVIVYGGVFPTYHWRDVLAESAAFDYIVRGEGEETAALLAGALEAGLDPLDPDLPIAGLAALRDGAAVATAPARAIADLETVRTAWELIDHRLYSYWGGKRAVVMQFSRGCPHPCNYCGQRGFWTRWRHRDPVAFAREIAWLHREHGVELINLADENPTSSPKAWRAFLEALIAERVDVLIVASTRADDIVRDRDVLHLYRKAGVIRFLLGTENTDEATLRLIAKGGSVSKDREAITLLRKHRIVSLATFVVGFEEERLSDLWRGFRQLLIYDPDQIQALYVTPHRWTPFFRLAAERRVIQTDRRFWDYKHQVLEMRHLRPWVLLLAVKLLEFAMQARPRALARTFFNPDPDLSHAMRWYTRIGKRVWAREMLHFFLRERRVRNGPTLAQFWGAPQDGEEYSMTAPRRGVARAVQPSETAPGKL